MSWGGKRPGAGRPKGAISLSTRAILEAASLGGEMPIEYMLRVMRDPNIWNGRRDKMALAAAAYLHPRIAPVVENVETENDGPTCPPSASESANHDETLPSAPPEMSAVNDGA